jgi:hypothetical protein
MARQQQLIFHEDEMRRRFTDLTAEGAAVAVYLGRPARAVGDVPERIYLVQWSDEPLARVRREPNHPVRVFEARMTEVELVEANFDGAWKPEPETTG